MINGKLPALSLANEYLGLAIRTNVAEDKGYAEVYR
jgi:hypothetical protein